MPPQRSRPHTVGSAAFDPDAFFESWDQSCLPQNDDFRAAIIKAFNLKSNDDYVYHAIASVTLAQVQQAINHGAQGGLHAWYRDEEGHQIPPPPSADITAYTSIFSPTTATTKALTAFASNAKKDSLRALIAQHLQSQLLLPSLTSGLTLPPKSKTPLTNPYYEIWAWSCQTLEWAGPLPSTAAIKQSHHILPVLYHHFGCICPTHDAISLLSQLCRPAGPKGPQRGIVEIGSGNGYWAYVLRRAGLDVTAVDNQLSAWRSTWIGDTVVADGVEWLARNERGREKVMLLVYPQVSGDFTGKVVRAYEGDTVVVAGTQNENRFTGFKGERVEEWMEREGWGLVCRVPLPSFAGKDEGLFVFRREGGGW